MHILYESQIWGGRGDLLVAHISPSTTSLWLCFDWEEITAE